MKCGGKGGSNTTSGAIFEKDPVVNSAIIAACNAPGENISSLKKTAALNVIKELGANININTKKLIPDCMLIDYNRKQITIFEQKYQDTAGSVDEKIQTGACKKWKWKRVTDTISGGGWTSTYCYVLSDWFKKKEYQTDLEYLDINNVGYCFASQFNSPKFAETLIGNNSRLIYA